MSLASLSFLDKDVTNVPGRASAFGPKIKARVRRGQAGTPAPEAAPAAADHSVRLEPPDAAERPGPSLGGPLPGPARPPRPPSVEEAGRLRGREPAAVLSAVTRPPVEQPSTAAPVHPPAPVANDGANQTAGAKRRIPHSTTGGRRRTAFRGAAEYDDHFLTTGEVNTAGMTLKDILRMADAKEKERNVDDVRRTPREEEAEERQARARTPDEPDIRALAPQIRVVDGQIVVDQQSLTASAQASNPVVSQHYQRVEESGSRLNSNTYLNRKPTKRWTDADTVVFYKALRQFGTDFTTIQKLFPNRSRHQIKNKYLNEDRQHPKAIEAALNHKSKDRSHYEEMIARLQAATDAAEPAAGHEPRGPTTRGTNEQERQAPGENTPEVGQSAEPTERSASGVIDPTVNVAPSVTGLGNRRSENRSGPVEEAQRGSVANASQQSTARVPTQESQALDTKGAGEPSGEAEASGPFTYLQRSMQRRVERGYREGA